MNSDDEVQEDSDDTKVTVTTKCSLNNNHQDRLGNIGKTVKTQR